MIIGAAKPNSFPSDDTSQGHHYTFEFNGVNININQNGEYTITHRGPTDINGNVTDGGQNKSTIQLDKTGNVNLTAPATANVNVSAGININETANAQIHLQAPNINLSNTQALAIDPILKANAAYVAAFHAKNAGVIAALTATAAALTAEAAAFTALATPLRRLKATGTSYDASSGNGLYRCGCGHNSRHSSDFNL